MIDDDLKVKSFKDKRLINPLHFVNIMKSFERRSINLDIVVDDKDYEEAKQNNDNYVISINFYYIFSKSLWSRNYKPTH